MSMNLIFISKSLGSSSKNLAGCMIVDVKYMCKLGKTASNDEMVRKKMLHSKHLHIWMCVELVLLVTLAFSTLFPIIQLFIINGISSKQTHTYTHKHAIEHL